MQLKHCTWIYSVTHELTFAGIDALGPRVAELGVARASTVVGPSTARSATASFAGLLECGALRAPGWRLRTGCWAGLGASAVTSGIEGFHNNLNRIEKTLVHIFVPRVLACLVVPHQGFHAFDHAFRLGGAAMLAFHAVLDGCGTTAFHLTVVVLLHGFWAGEFLFYSLHLRSVCGHTLHHARNAILALDRCGHRSVGMLLALSKPTSSQQTFLRIKLLTFLLRFCKS